MNHRAQGALEYLLLIGGAVLVAAIVISLITTVPAGIDPATSAECLSQKSLAACSAITGCTAYKQDMATQATLPGEFFICMAGQTSCGDSVVDAGEVCDPPGVTGNVRCNSSCTGYDVYGCTILVAEGNYRLVQDISGSSSMCLRIGGNNIALDCGSHTITGTGTAPLIGIYANGLSGLSIQNCQVSNYRYGIRITGSPSVTMNNNRLCGNIIDDFYCAISTVTGTGNSADDAPNNCGMAFTSC
jgi:hypothetical protein